MPPTTFRCSWSSISAFCDSATKPAAQSAANRSRTAVSSLLSGVRIHRRSPCAFKNRRFSHVLNTPQVADNTGESTAHSNTGSNPVGATRFFLAELATCGVSVPRRDSNPFSVPLPVKAPAFLSTLEIWMDGRLGEGTEPPRVERAHRFCELVGDQLCLHCRGLDVAVSEVLLNGSEVPHLPLQPDRDAR